MTPMQHQAMPSTDLGPISLSSILANTGISMGRDESESQKREHEPDSSADLGDKGSESKVAKVESESVGSKSESVPIELNGKPPSVIAFTPPRRSRRRLAGLVTCSRNTVTPAGCEARYHPALLLSRLTTNPASFRFSLAASSYSLAQYATTLPYPRHPHHLYQHFDPYQRAPFQFASIYHTVSGVEGEIKDEQNTSSQPEPEDAADQELRNLMEGASHDNQASDAPSRNEDSPFIDLINDDEPVSDQTR